MGKDIKNKNIYGMELILDLYHCDYKVIASKKKLREFIVKICRLIKMKRYGKPLIERFGFGMDFTAGYSIVQLIESSSITGHFSDLWESVYLNIFSCKPFDAKKATNFSKKFFRAKKIREHLIIRK